MKVLLNPLAWAALLWCLHAPMVFAQSTLPKAAGPTQPWTNTVILKGIFELPDYRAAVIDIRHHPAAATNHSPFAKQMILREGQRQLDRTVKGAHVEFEMLSVDVQHGLVRLRKKGELVTCELESPAKEGDVLELGSGPSVTVRLVEIDIRAVLDLYVNQRETTALIHPLLKAPRVSLAARVTKKAELAEALETAITAHGIVIKHEGKFDLIVPAELADSAALVTRAPESYPPDAGAEIPAGAFNLGGLDLRQVLPLYEQLCGRRWIRDDRLPNRIIAFRNQSPLTKAEVLQAFETLFGWSGLKVVLVDDDSFKVLPIGSR